MIKDSILVQNVLTKQIKNQFLKCLAFFRRGRKRGIVLFLRKYSIVPHKIDCSFITIVSVFDSAAFSKIFFHLKFLEDMFRDLFPSS